ncbi:MAG: transposase [Treponema sp.]|nr:transposase [Treponema sp.]
MREKKRHTLKTQVIIERKSKKIIDVRQDKGSVHDFKIYKETIGSNIAQDIGVDADLGYLGIDKLHPNSRIPKKPSKHHKLTKREKAYNKRLARKRVIIEHINAKIKTFKIMACPYRNHCQRHLLRMSLICGIINYVFN